MKKGLVLGLGIIAVLIIGLLIYKNSISIHPSSQTDNNLSTMNSVPPSNAMKNISLPTPAMLIDKNKSYTAILHTDKGDIKIALHADKTPVTVNNFVYLARKNFYDHTIFHRVIKGFMIQGGDPKGDGTGSPGYKFADEPFEGNYDRGAVAMANSGPNTNGSQFFIMHQNYDLPKNYVNFGNVVSGMDVVDTIANAVVEPNAIGEPSEPKNPVVIQSVDILEQ